MTLALTTGMLLLVGIRQRHGVAIRREVCQNPQKLWCAAAHNGHPGLMHKTRTAKTTNAGQRHASAEVASPKMTSAAPAGEDLSEPGLRWQHENRAAIDCYSEWIAEHGLPLEEFRRF